MSNVLTYPEAESRRLAGRDPYRNVYHSAFPAVAASAAQDVFEIVAGSSVPETIINYIEIGQYTDFGDAAAEILSVSLIKAYTTSGSGGGTITPAPLRTGAAAASATVERNNTTVASAGTPITLYAGAFNIQAGWIWDRPPSERIILNAGERLVVRISAPADSITMNGVLIHEEIV